MLAVGVDELQGDQLEPALLEAPNDVTDETALDAVGLMITMRHDPLSSTRLHGRRAGDQSEGESHLDHDVRAFVIVRHDQYFFLWLMQLTIGEEREMGRCEKERADFNQETDHPSIRLAKFGDSRPRPP